MSLAVTEIFHSIQGESLHAGRPCVFIRLSGCNLRCRYCDTTYAHAPGESLAEARILERVNAFGCNLVELTGGEPLLQPETPRLIKTLIAGGHEVLLETNGTIDPFAVDPQCVKIVDIKCPSSGEAGRHHPNTLSRLTAHDQVKFVLGTREDYEFARVALAEVPSRVPVDHVLFSPVSGQLPPRTLADWILGDRLAVRLHLQLHKHIWSGEDRGR